MAHYLENKKLEGIELYFDNAVPDKDLCNQMKAVGLRYTRYKNCWYTSIFSIELKILESINHILCTLSPATSITVSEHREYSNGIY